MRKINLTLFLLFLFWQTPASCEIIGESSLFPKNMRCEYLVNPKGLDVLYPRLSWTFCATDPENFGQRQTAYRVLVSSSKKELEKIEGSMWDSGWVESDKMQNIIYEGKLLKSDRSYFWKVSVKDEKGYSSNWSESANWTTGLLKTTDWKAKWIGTNKIFDPSLANCNLNDPWFRKTINLKSNPGKATLFLASVGYHEVYVNGKKIGKDVLSPSVTDHTKRARYVTYDIGKELRAGKNVIGIWLGTSWSIFGPYITADRVETPMFIAQAAIYKEENPDSNSQPILLIQSNNSWKTHSSPNRLLGTWATNAMGGELWDANKEINDWNLLSCDESSWDKATEYNPTLILSSQKVEGNRLFEEIKPVEIIAKPDGSYRVDMGVNFAGWTEIRVKGKPGDQIDFLFSERAQKDMTFNIHSAFIIGNEGKGVFRNRFNYSSGRWITIRGLKEKPKIKDIKGWLVRTNYQSATTFECSDSLQNWIYNRIKWTFENLSLGGYVVDCPQRERLGYGGDAHATSETGMFNYKLGAFYTKWMQDWRDVKGTEPIVGNMHDENWARKSQMSGRILNNGILPHSAPTYMGGGGPAWGGIVVSLPWLFYQHQGDTRILKKNYEMIKDWLSFLDINTKDNMLHRYGGAWDFLGDWLWPNAFEEGMNNDKPETLAFNNSYRVFNLRTAAKIARILDKDKDALRWEREADVSSRAIHSKFYNERDSSYADGSMSNLAAALLAEIPPAKLRNAIMKRLEKEILKINKGHIDVGITGGAMLFKLLRNSGRDDLIYSMTSKMDYPSWGYMKKNGATTIWEMWERNLPGHSLLHSSFLYPGAWYVEGVAGIHRNTNTPGFQKFIIRLPLLKESQISWAKATFDSPAGLIKMAWRREEGNLEIEISVPPNCVAELQLLKKDVQKISTKKKHIKKIGIKNGYCVFELASGRYSL